MAYVAVRGGQDAIKKSIELLSLYKTRGSVNIELEALKNRMSLLIDKIMSEAGLISEDYAAIALKQSEGSPEEAVFLLRAYRTTLSRNYYSLPIDCEEMFLLRRISSAFKNVTGGQYLGPTYDYTHRLLNFNLKDDKADDITLDDIQEQVEELKAGRVTDLLREEGLIEEKEDDSEPLDITQFPINFKAPRSARLQTLTRAESGYINGLAYAGIRGFGSCHPTIGELRTGYIKVKIQHPIYKEENIIVGEFLATEVESLFSEELENDEKDPLKIMQQGKGDKADTSKNSLTLGIGYGLVLGRNDNKAISMSILDYVLETEGDSILQDEEFVLLHGDCLEMNGFISHLKLPHYVTFQSKLDRVRFSKKERE